MSGIGETADAPRDIADEELELLSRVTGEADLSALRAHVQCMWRRAVSGSAPVYLCVRALMFLKPSIPRHPAYQRAQALMRDARGGGGGGKARPLWVDVGACTGTDVRQLRVDGLAADEVAAVDVPSARHYWEVGLDMYRDAANPPCTAFFGDITDDSVLPAKMSASGSSDDSSSSRGQAEPGEQSQTSGRPAQRPEGGIARLAGRAQVVSCTAVLHCLGREQVECLLSKIRVLLRPGGLLLGSTLVSLGEPRDWVAAYQRDRPRWLHSAESLAALLRALGYEQVEVAPAQWRDVHQPTQAINTIMESHVGGSQGSDRGMLAFTAVKPSAGGV